MANKVSNITAYVQFEGGKQGFIQQILNRLGLGTTGKLQKLFATTVMAKADPYVPFDTGHLKNSVRMENGGKVISYNTEYAHYQWRGGEGWNYSNNETGLRGAYWVDRMWADKQDEITRILERSMKR